jgi:hypothetical protein
MIAFPLALVGGPRRDDPHNARSIHMDHCDNQLAAQNSDRLQPRFVGMAAG